MPPDATAILHLEDSDLDAELIRARLERSMLDLRVDRVSGRAEYEARLRGRRYAAIISDYNFPGFDGLAAMALARDLQPGVPFIFVSGTMGEDLAVETLKQGATDYVLKQRLARLPVAVERALAEARGRADRAATEAALRRSEERFEFVRKSANVGFWYCDLPFDLMDWDEVVKAHFWLPPDAVVHMDDFYALLHPDDRGPTRAAIERSIADRVAYDVDYRTVDPESGAERWVRAVGRAAYAADGTPTRFDGITTDVTGRKQTEQRLRESQENLQFALKAGKMGAWSLAFADGALRTSETCRTNYGRRPDEAFTYADLAGTVHPDDRDRWREAVDKAVAAGGDLEIEYRTLWPDGSEHWAQVRASCLTDAAGAVAGMSGVSMDITDRKRTEIEKADLYARLKDEDRRKDEFLATLAHELRNPLAPVRTGLTVLKHARGEGDQRRAREMMDRQVAHMVRLIDDLLDVSRITRGKIELRREPTDVRAVVDAALEVSRPLVEESKHELVVTLAPGPLPLFADPTRLAQVVSNLVNNAAKYTPRGGRIELTSARAGDQAVIRVADNGVGIPADMLPKVFEMFTQVGRTIDRAQGGLGIGLALVTRLAEMHGGTIAAASAGLGLGSTFTLTLPIDKGEGGRGKGEKETNGGADSAFRPRPSALKVLVVDDNADGADSLAMLLDLSGHATTTAYSGTAALAAARKFRPDVVLLDIGLPGMNGYEVAKAMRADPALAGAKLVALTGWGTDDDRQRAKEAGFDHHLTKPVEPAEVARVLAALV